MDSVQTAEIGQIKVAEQLGYGIARSTLSGDIVWHHGLLQQDKFLHSFFPAWAAKALAALGARNHCTADWQETHPLDRSRQLKISVSVEGTELVWLLTDVQLCRQSCSAIVDAREQLSMVLDLAPVGIWMQNGSGKLSFVNRAFCDAMGISEAEFLAVERYDMLLPTEFVPSCLASDAKALASETPTTTIQQLPMVDGQIHDLEVYKAVKRDATGRPVALVGVAIEATAKLADGQALRKAKETAESLSHAKTEFINLMSHELLTPINGILGMAEVLGFVEQSPEQKAFVDNISKAGNNLRRCIEAVLTYTRLDLRSADESVVDFHLASEIDALFDDLGGGRAAPGVLASCEIGKALDCLAHGDQLALKRVLSALLRNAVQFTQQGEIRLTAQARNLTERRIEVEFVLSDTGSGIPEKFMPYLFTPFRQAEATLRRSHEGIGLDLALSKKLVDRMGGELLIESAEGRGSTARLMLGFDLA